MKRWVTRAIKKSDTLVKEVFDRVGGHVANIDETSPFRGNVIIVDIPRPPKVIDAGSNGHKPPEEEWSAGGNGKPPSDNNGHD